MNTEQFNEIVEARCGKTKKVLVKKSVEYASPTDRFHNFKVAARIGEPQTQQQAALGMLKKHIVSLTDMVEATAHGIYPSAEMLDEKLGDIVNYVILLEGMFIEDSPPAPLVVEGTCAELRYKAVEHQPV
jgi:hypothetical protein